jgi:hypothetical protein
VKINIIYNLEILLIYNKNIFIRMWNMKYYKYLYINAKYTKNLIINDIILYYFLKCYYQYNYARIPRRLPI